MTPSEEKHFDDLLRGKFADEAVPPPPSVWPVVSRTLPPTPVAFGWPKLTLSAALGVLLGVLLGWQWGAQWGGGRPTARATATAYAHATRPTTPVTAPKREQTAPLLAAASPKTTPKTAPETVSKTSRPALFSHGSAVPGERRPVGLGVKNPGEKVAAKRELKAGFGQPGEKFGSGAAAGSPADSLRKHLAGNPGRRAGEQTGAGLVRPGLWPTALALDSAIRTPGQAAPAPENRAAVATALLGRTALVAQQRRVLAALQQQLDSLKRALPEIPPTLAAAEATPATAPDSLRSPLARPRRWGLTAFTERSSASWGDGLSYPAPATTRERLLPGYARGVQLERRLGHDRWRASAGLGEQVVQAQFQHTSDRTGETRYVDSTTTVRLDVYASVDTTFLIQLDSIARLEPRLNGSGQVIRYDTLWTPRIDTSYQIITSHDTVRSTQVVAQTRVEAWRQSQLQQLRPEYRFWTLPVALHYDLVRAGRWRLGLGLGAQVLVFRGGTRPMWVGDGYELRRVGARNGPFRPVSVALSAALEIRFALTDRLHLVSGAQVRAWLKSPVAGQPRPVPVPAGQVGLSWQF